MEELSYSSSLQDNSVWKWKQQQIVWGFEGRCMTEKWPGSVVGNLRTASFIRDPPPDDRRTCRDLWAGSYLSSLAPVQPCNPCSRGVGISAGIRRRAGRHKGRTVLRSRYCSPLNYGAQWGLYPGWDGGTGRPAVRCFFPSLQAWFVGRVCLKWQDGIFWEICPHFVTF